ncbi:MAG: RHS repeat-associated core domain-containing protein [Myxococcales bacterium]
MARVIAPLLAVLCCAAPARAYVGQADAPSAEKRVGTLVIFRFVCAEGSGSPTRGMHAGIGRAAGGCASGVAIQGYAFTLGPTGNRTRIDEADGTFREFTYDDLYRLTGETVTKAEAVQYAGGFIYDAVGNRLSQTKNGVLTSSSFDERDRLQKAGTTDHYWDDEGNLITQDDPASGDSSAFWWDFDHRLVKVQKQDGTVVEHTYDADGNRVQTKTTKAGVTTVQNYLVDTSGALSHVVAETDEAGALKALYVRGDDLLAVIRASGTKYVHADGLGSIRKLTNESGAVTDSYTYNAFGELLEHVGSDPQPYMFAGEAWEGGTGLYYNRARWLDVGTGKFVSEDPFRGSEWEPATLHRYSYAAQDPVRFIDPSGGQYTAYEMCLVVSIVSSLNAAAITGLRTALSGGSPSDVAAVEEDALLTGFLLIAAITGGYDLILAAQIMFGGRGPMVVNVGGPLNNRVTERSLRPDFLHVDMVDEGLPRNTVIADFTKMDVGELGCSGLRTCRLFPCQTAATPTPTRSPLKHPGWGSSTLWRQRAQIPQRL